MSAPDVLCHAETEPEAAHLRNVLRQIRQIATSPFDNHRRPNQRVIAELCDRALARSATNGAVIDALVKENGDLQSEILELREQLRQYRETLIAKGVHG